MLGPIERTRPEDTLDKWEFHHTSMRKNHPFCQTIRSAKPSVLPNHPFCQTIRSAKPSVLPRMVLCYGKKACSSKNAKQVLIFLQKVLT